MPAATLERVARHVCDRVLPAMPLVLSAALRERSRAVCCGESTSSVVVACSLLLEVRGGGERFVACYLSMSFCTFASSLGRLKNKRYYPEESGLIEFVHVYVNLNAPDLTTTKTTMHTAPFLCVFGGGEGCVCLHKYYVQLRYNKVPNAFRWPRRNYIF